MPQDTNRILHFDEVDRAPVGGGIYAWYCRYKMSDRDIEALANRLEQLEPVEQRSHVSAFLEKHLFRAFREQPYHISVSGALKPSYQGSVPHVPSISASLVDRICEQPSRLRVISKVLGLCVPHFSSPIYIGSATSLRQRLRVHHVLVDKYREAACMANLTPDIPEELDQTGRRDHQFAYEATIERQLNPNNLWVAVLETDIPREVVYGVENLLNRINYPLCGRT